MDLYYKVNDNKYSSIKQVLKEEFRISTRLYLKLRNEKHIFLNGKYAFGNEDICCDDIIGVDLDFVEDNSNIVPTNIDLSILYEDKYLLIINKQSSIAIHPSLRHFENTLSNGVKFYFDNINLHRKIRIVNRLDKDTSGIVIFAKNEYIQECLISQMKSNIFQKEYIAILDGILEKKKGMINAPISRKEGSIIERCIYEKGQEAITHYEVIKEIKDYSVVHFRLETGRTHQIRVHSQYLGHSILGDTLYGKVSTLIGRQALHAQRIKFIHPITKQSMIIEAPIPDDMKKIIGII